MQHQHQHQQQVQQRGFGDQIFDLLSCGGGGNRRGGCFDTPRGNQPSYQQPQQGYAANMRGSAYPQQYGSMPPRGSGYASPRVEGYASPMNGGPRATSPQSRGYDQHGRWAIGGSMPPPQQQAGYGSPRGMPAPMANGYGAQRNGYPQGQAPGQFPQQQVPSNMSPRYGSPAAQRPPGNASPRYQSPHADRPPGYTTQSSDQHQMAAGRLVQEGPMLMFGKSLQWKEWYFRLDEAGSLSFSRDQQATTTKGTIRLLGANRDSLYSVKLVDSGQKGAHFELQPRAELADRIPWVMCACQDEAQRHQWITAFTAHNFAQASAG